MQATVLLGLLAGAHAGAMELTKGNFDELVVNSGKVAPQPALHSPTHADTLQSTCTFEASAPPPPGSQGAFVKFLAPW